MEKPIIAIAGCKNSGKSSLCRYITYIMARVEGLLLDDPYSGVFTNKNLIQLPKDASKNVYIGRGNSFYQQATMVQEPSIIVDSFARPVKEICTDILGVPQSSVYGSDAEKNQLTDYCWDKIPENIKLKFSDRKSGKISAREIMQIIGTDIFREYFSNDIWVNALIKRSENSDAELLIVDDLRFNSEAKILMQKNAMFIHLQRMWGMGGSHASENGLDLSIFENYPYYCSIPDVDMSNKNDIAFDAIKEYFKYVISEKEQLSEQVSS